MPQSSASIPARAWHPAKRAWCHGLEPLERRALLAATAFHSGVSYAFSDSPDFVTLADFNGDGHQDMAVSSYAGSMLSVRLGQSNGTFLAATNIPLSVEPDSLGVADLNRDGKMDLIAAHFDNNTISVLLGNGNGTFFSPTSIAAGTGPRAFAVGDFNNDGFEDLLMAKSFDKNLTLLRGNGNGSFQAPVSYAINYTPTDVTAGDFNGDGNLDLAASDFYTDKVYLQLGNGDGTFQPAVSASVGAGPTHLAAGDFNGDGKLDVVTANFLSGNVSVLRGNGNGTFLATTNFAAGGGATFVAVSDFNRDGKLDLAVANANADNVSVLIGNGSGSFALDSTQAVGNSPRSIAVGQLNADAYADLVVTNQGANTVSVLLAIPGGGPTAIPGGPYNVPEGGAVVLNGSGSTGTGLTYAWDLDGDGVFGESGAAAMRGNEIGANPTFLAGGLDGPSSRTVRLRVTDSGGGSHTATGTVNIANVAPTLTISGPADASAGTAYILSLSASDPGNDTITGWVINWGDGIIETINGNPSSAQHTYTSGGVTRVISATATDEDGTWSANTLSVVVSGTDTIHPTATLSASNVIIGAGLTHQFIVTYDDNVAVDVAFLDNNDILVTGPAGFSQLATLVSWVRGSGNKVIATYRISAPGGSWDWPDNGAYTVLMQQGQVRDTTGNSVRHGTLGGFQAAIVPADLAGNALGSAMDLGTMRAGRIRALNEWTGTVDRNDFYRFTIDSPVTLNVSLMNLTDNADLMLLDSAGNRILYSNRTGTTAETFTRSMTPGTYYLRVLFAGQVGTSYRLRLEAPDNSISQARDIGTISPGTVRLVDEYAGADDRNDYYRFTLTQPMRVYVKLTGMTNNADLMLLDSSGQRIAYSNRAGATDEYVLMDLTPGTFFIRVLFPGSGGTSYRLRIEGLRN